MGKVVVLEIENMWVFSFVNELVLVFVGLCVFVLIGEGKGLKRKCFFKEGSRYSRKNKLEFF